MGMTATRIRILENQQTGVAKKVYGAVPINEELAKLRQLKGLLKSLS